MHLYQIMGHSRYSSVSVLALCFSLVVNEYLRRLLTIVKLSRGQLQKKENIKRVQLHFITCFILSFTGSSEDGDRE